MKRLSLLVSAFAFLTAPAVSADDEPQLSEDPRLGERVNRICFARNINNFSFVREYDDVVLLEKGVKKWFLAELSGACSYSSLRFARAVAIDSRPRGGCVSRGDRLVFSDGLSFDDRSAISNVRRCTIGAIYKWDENAERDQEDEDGR